MGMGRWRHRRQCLDWAAGRPCSRASIDPWYSVDSDRGVAGLAFGRELACLAMVPIAFFWGAVGWALQVQQNNELIRTRETQGNGNLAVALNESALYLGSAIGAASSIVAAHERVQTHSLNPRETVEERFGTPVPSLLSSRGRRTSLRPCGRKGCVQSGHSLVPIVYSLIVPATPPLLHC